jgi:hypothetical protein
LLQNHFADALKGGDRTAAGGLDAVQQQLEAIKLLDQEARMADSPR